MQSTFYTLLQNNLISKILLIVDEKENNREVWVYITTRNVYYFDNMSLQFSLFNTAKD